MSVVKVIFLDYTRDGAFSFWWILAVLFFELVSFVRRLIGLCDSITYAYHLRHTKNSGRPNYDADWWSGECNKNDVFQLYRKIRQINLER